MPRVSRATRLAFSDDGGVGLVSGRRRDADVRSGAGADGEERVAHVVAVADVREFQAAQSAEALLEREEIGQRLAGMIFVRERVDHGNIRVGSEFFKSFLREDARDDSLHPTLEILGNVADGLALAEAGGSVIEKRGRSAEIGDADLESDARAQRGLLEDQHEDAAGQRGPVAIRVCLHFRGEAEEIAQLRRTPLGSGEEIPLQCKR